jgi:hypothetical protein
MVGLCNIPTFDYYMLKLPSSFSIYKKCVNICEVDVLGLGFKVSFRLGGYISWFYIDLNFMCYYDDYTRACKANMFCSIWC